MNVTISLRLKPEQIEEFVEDEKAMGNINLLEHLQDAGYSLWDANEALQQEDGTVLVTIPASAAPNRTQIDPAIGAAIAWIAAEVDTDAWDEAQLDNMTVTQYLDEYRDRLPCVVDPHQATIVNHKDGTTTVTFSREFGG